MSTGAHSDPVGFKTLETFSDAPAINRWLYSKINDEIQGRVLEIGSGIGNISEMLLKDFSSVTLSDLRSEYCQILEQKFPGHAHVQGIYTLDLSSPDFNTRYVQLLEKFDTVIALNVIEHISDDLAAINNAKSLLRDNGKLIILVPAFPLLFNSLDRELGHYRRYKKSQLKKLAEAAGLKNSKCIYFNAAAIMGWWVSGRLLKEKIISPSKLQFYNMLVPLFKILDVLVSPFFGISLISTSLKI
jgi:2-polyprenyl-3-methyl-5-hydroxy-6-metoxy-1,4-benzoquinol methylase